MPRKILYALAMFAFVLFPTNVCGEEYEEYLAIIEKEASIKLKTPMEDHNVTLGGVVKGLESYIKKNYKLCTNENTDVAFQNGIGDSGVRDGMCYVDYGPDIFYRADEDGRHEIHWDYWNIAGVALTKWVEDEDEDYLEEYDSFEYRFYFNGKQFEMHSSKFRNSEISRNKATSVFKEVVNSKEAKGSK